MYQLNPLLESKNHLVKILSRYSPTERDKIRQTMIKLGKSNGGWYDQNEYASKIINGQKERLRKIANDNNRKIKFIDANFSKQQSSITPSATINRRQRDYINFDGLDPINTTRYRYNVRGNDVAILPSINKDISVSPLQKADIASHEADEYSLKFKNSKKLGISPDLGSELTWIYNRTSPGKHHLGALRRELKRRKNLSSLYDEVFDPRDNDEIIHNNASLKTLLKYIGSIRNKEILQNGDYKSLNLEILRKQKKIIEDFIKRKDEIESLPYGLTRRIKLNNLKWDIKQYNSKLALNRKHLNIQLPNN